MREFLIDWDKSAWGEDGQNVHITEIDESDEHHDHCVKHCKCTHCKERREDA